MFTFSADKPRTHNGGIHIPATRFTRSLLLAYSTHNEQGKFRPVVVVIAGIAPAGRTPDGDYDIYIIGALNLHYRGGGR